MSAKKRTPAKRPPAKKAVDKKPAAKRQPAKKPVAKRRQTPEKWVIAMMFRGAVGYWDGTSNTGNAFDTDSKKAVLFPSSKAAIECGMSLKQIPRTAKMTVLKYSAITKRNPATTKQERARELYRQFTGADPDNAKLVSVPGIETATVVGHVEAIEYETVRDGKKQRYIHKFKKHARPEMVTAHDGSKIGLRGGKYKFTDRGIIDNPQNSR